MSGRTSALDWEARFQAERTPWERPSLNPAFVAWRAAGDLAPCRILLPGAGRSGEPLAMARDGFDVTVVDLTPTAVEVQRVRLHAAALPGSVFQADLLEWEPPAPFDAIYDQTCLCALPPAILPDYVARLHRWLRPGGMLFILFMQTGADGGPPFDCPLDRMQTLFGAGWIWPRTIAEPVLHGMTTREIPMVLTRV
jgi:SAM-dependent methyltransferase